MGFWSALLGLKPAEPIEPPRDRADAQFHIDRFTLAIEQCTKGPERLAELQVNLDYWLAVKRLNDAEGV